MSDSNSSSHGVGVLGVIQIVLIILKIVNVINCSWWMVFIPTYISAGIILIVLIVVLIACVIENGRWKCVQDVNPTRSMKLMKWMICTRRKNEVS